MELCLTSATQPSRLWAELDEKDTGSVGAPSDGDWGGSLSPVDLEGD